MGSSTGPPYSLFPLQRMISHLPFHHYPTLKCQSLRQHFSEDPNRAITWSSLTHKCIVFDLFLSPFKIIFSMYFLLFTCTLPIWMSVPQGQRLQSFSLNFFSICVVWILFYFPILTSFLDIWKSILSQSLNFSQLQAFICVADSLRDAHISLQSSSFSSANCLLIPGWKCFSLSIT